MSAHSLSDLAAGLPTSPGLSADEIAAAIQGLIAPEGSIEEKALFLRALREKGETSTDLAGFAQALLAHAVNPEIDPAQMDGPLLDVCGTGGDRLHIFNVSTTAMFILAAGGAVVVKHGNRAITSQSGGADVLEALGVRIDLPVATLRECVQRHGLGFLFAPHYHPVFKAISPVRAHLAAEGIPTIFNLLGPMLNPARPPHQLIGLFSGAILPKYAEALELLGRQSAWVVHGSGMDELSVTGVNDVCALTPAGLHAFQVDPASLGFTHTSLEELLGGTRERNAEILVGILSGEMHGAKRDLVLLNAAAGFVVCGLAKDLPDGLVLAAEQIENGRALGKLEALQSVGT